MKPMKHMEKQYGKYEKYGFQHFFAISPHFRRGQEPPVETYLGHEDILMQNI